MSLDMESNMSLKAVTRRDCLLETLEVVVRLNALLARNDFTMTHASIRVAREMETTVSELLVELGLGDK